MTDIEELRARLTADEAWWESRARLWDAREKVFQARLEALQARNRAIDAQLAYNGERLQVLSGQVGVALDRLVEHTADPDAHNGGVQ